MVKLIRKAFGKLSEYHNSRFVVGSSDEAFKLRSDRVFDQAKKLSDFVGMIVRLAFLQLAYRYFLIISPKTEGIYGYIFGFCAVSAFGLTIMLGIRIIQVIFLWELLDARKATNPFMRVVLFVFAFTSTMIVYLGTSRLTTDLAKQSAILAGG